MSGWDSYITGASGLLNRGPIEKAGIFGINGATWAQHDINPIYQELISIKDLFTLPDKGYTEGFSLGGKRYALLRVDDEEILHGRGKTAGGESPNAITIQKTKQALIIGIGTEEASGGEVSMAVGAIGDHLARAGY